MNRYHGLRALPFLMTVLWAVLFITACSEEPQPREPVEQPRSYRGTIVAVGDSLTAGLGVDEESAYPARLEKTLRENGHDYRVINAGVSGETTSGLVSRLEWIMTMEPDIVIIESGANDGLRGIDLAIPEKNLRRILEFFREQGVVTVFTGMKMVVNLGPEYTSGFDRIYPELAREYGVIFMPFFLEAVAADPALNLEDGIHPNSRGYEVIVENLYPLLLEAIAEFELKQE